MPFASTSLYVSYYPFKTSQKLFIIFFSVQVSDVYIIIVMINAYIVQFVLLYMAFEVDMLVCQIYSSFNFGVNIIGIIYLRAKMCELCNLLCVTIPVVKFICVSYMFFF